MVYEDKREAKEICGDCKVSTNITLPLNIIGRGTFDYLHVHVQCIFMNRSLLQFCHCLDFSLHVSNILKIQ